jgi:hypothetical protein
MTSPLYTGREEGGWSREESPSHQAGIEKWNRENRGGFQTGDRILSGDRWIR